jgi:hypothetical protein
MRARHGAMTELDAGALARMRSSGVAEFRESSKFPKSESGRRAIQTPD